MNPARPYAATVPLLGRLLHAEQVRLLYAGLPAALFANALLATLLVGVQWPALSPALASGWLLLMGALLALRGATCLSYRRASPDAGNPAPGWLRRFQVGAIATGAVWGVAGVALFPAGETAHQAFLAFVLAGVSAGAITSLAADRVSAVGFVVPALLPLAASFVMEGGAMPLAMGLMVALFLVFVAASAARMQRNLLENVRLRAEAIEQQDALRESEARLRQMADGAPALIWMSDTQNLGTWYNKRWLDYTGRSMEQELGHGWAAGVHPDDLGRCVPYCDAAFSARRTFEMEFRLRRADGSYGWVADTGIPQFKSDGEFTGYIGYCWDIADRKQAESDLRKQQQLGEVIARVQSQFIRETGRHAVFDGLLTDILAMTGSEYGFISEVLRTPAGDPYLKSYALTNIAWDDTTRALYEARAETGMEFFNLETLFGAALTSGEPVIANDPCHDPRRGGLPEGHPALTAFLGIPIHHGGKLVAMLGIANRPGGYHLALIDFLHPLLVTLGQLVEAARIKRQHHEDQTVLARLSRVASQTTNGVVITDAEGRVEWINEGFTRITGYTLDEMRGRRPGDVLQGEATDPATVAQMRKALSRADAFDVEVMNYTKAGAPYWMHISCNPLLDAAGILQGFMAIESDVTERKRMERMKSEFVSTVSHELRTPLTAIAGSLSLLAGGVLGELPAQMREMVAIAHKNSQRLTCLIDDLLDMEKLTAGKLRLEIRAQDPMPLVEQAIRENQAYADRHRVRYALTGRVDGVAVEVDAQRLQQVLANLLSNAAKFSPEGGTVNVQVLLRGNTVHIQVIDHGPGIPAEFRERIFQKFSQADASDTRRQGGTGLGLSISRELVERMGGRIGFESVEGEGATFYVELPACPAS